MMRRIWTIALGVVADTLRRRIVYVVLMFAAVLVFAIPSLPDYGLGVQAAVFKEVALALAYATALVVTLSLAANRIPSEVERRTVYNVLSKPVSRWEYLIGTWLGIFLVAAGALAAFTVVELIVGALTYGQAMWVLWEGALGIWLEMGVLAAVAVAVSSVLGPVVVVTATVAVMFIGHARSTLAGGEGALALKPFYPSLDAFNIINPVAHGSGVPPLYLASMIVVFVGLSCIALIVGGSLFARRDL